jgi:predicted nuclease of predicted toxin-antitoxin system
MRVPRRAVLRERLVILCDDRDYLGIAARHGQPVKIITET